MSLIKCLSDWLIFLFSVLMFLDDAYMLMSSANMDFNVLLFDDLSCEVYIIYRRGERLLPCGTPKFCLMVSDVVNFEVGCSVGEEAVDESCENVWDMKVDE